MFAGGGTTCAVSVPPPERVNEPPVADGGGGTGCERMSPLRVLPQLLRSRLTWDGGGAITAGAGSESLAAVAESRAGAETGGATALVVCETGARELAKSRWASCGAGATTLLASGFTARILSRETFGAGATTFVASGFAERIFSRATSGAGAILPERAESRSSAEPDLCAHWTTATPAMAEQDFALASLAQPGKSAGPRLAAVRDLASAPADWRRRNRCAAV